MNNFKPASTPVTEGCIAVIFSPNESLRKVNGEAVLVGIRYRTGEWGVSGLRARWSGKVLESSLFCIDGYDETQDRKFNHQG